MSPSHKLSQQKIKRTPQTKSVLASAISAVLVGVYGMPVRAEDDYRSAGKLSVSRGLYNVGSDDVFTGSRDEADSTEVSFEFNMGERWRGKITYNNLDGKKGGNLETSDLIGLGTAAGGYNIFHMQSGGQQTLNLDMVDFEAGYEIQLGETFNVEPHIGLRYIDMSQSSDQTGGIYFSGAGGLAYLTKPAKIQPVPAAFTAALSPAQLAAPPALGDANIEAVGLRFGLGADWQFSESFSMSADASVDYLYADKEIDGATTAAAVAIADDLEGDELIAGTSGDFAINYHVTHADEYDTGMTLSLGYHVQVWKDLGVDYTNQDEIDITLDGGYIRLAIDF